LWGKSSDSLRQRLRRGTFGDIFYLDKYLFLIRDTEGMSRKEIEKVIKPFLQSYQHTVDGLLYRLAE